MQILGLPKLVVRDPLDVGRLLHHLEQVSGFDELGRADGYFALDQFDFAFGLVPGLAGQRVEIDRQRDFVALGRVVLFGDESAVVVDGNLAPVLPLEDLDGLGVLNYVLEADGPELLGRLHIRELEDKYCVVVGVGLHDREGGVGGGHACGFDAGFEGLVLLEELRDGADAGRVERRARGDDFIDVEDGDLVSGAHFELLGRVHEVVLAGGQVGVERAQLLVLPFLNGDALHAVELVGVELVLQAEVEDVGREERVELFGLGDRVEVHGLVDGVVVVGRDQVGVGRGGREDQRPVAGHVGSVRVQSLLRLETCRVRRGGLLGGFSVCLAGLVLFESIIVILVAEYFLEIVGRLTEFQLIFVK